MSYIYYEDTENKISLKIPEENYIGCVSYKEPKEIQWPENYIHTLKNPCGTQKLGKIASGKKKVAILVSDYTRAVPVRILLPFLIEELHQAGIHESQIKIIVASGVHRPTTEQEKLQIIGEEWMRKLTIVDHNATNPDMLAFLGKTKRGTPIWINKLVLESDLRIALGQIEPHEFAGFTGGRKSILPGISGEETIQKNHSPEMIGHPLARPGILKGNPVHEDMVEVALKVGLDFIVNVVLNKELKIIGVFSGDMIKAHERGVNFVSSFSKIEITSPPDIIVTTPGKPLNVNLYQSIKALIALDAIVHPGSVIVLYSPCPEGLGSEDMLSPFLTATTLKEVTEKLTNNYKIQMDHAFLLSKILEKDVRIIACIPTVKPEIIKKMMMIPVDSVQEGLDVALKISRKNKPSVLVYPQPQRTLPTLT